jgi:hypothetical protein
VALILAVACINAFLVAGFLMHLLSEKKLIYTLLGFTRRHNHALICPSRLFILFLSPS